MFTVLMVLLLITVFTTFHRYGFTSDDVHGFERAKNTFAFLSSAGADYQGVGDFKITNFYGAMPDVIALALQKAFPSLGFDSRHLVSALFGAIGIFYTCRLGSFFGGMWVGLIAAVLLTFNPMWLGYMFVNIKDIPFATALLAASYHALRILDHKERPNWLSWLALAVWSGLLATTKILGLPMLAVVGFILQTGLFIEYRQFDLRMMAIRLAGIAAAVVLGTMACAPLFWPQLFLYTPSQTFAILLDFMDFSGFHNDVLLNGVRYPPDQIPRYYAVTYLLITTPLFLLILLFSSVPFAILGRKFSLMGLIAVPLAFLLVQAVMHSLVYNGARHFLFIVPFMMVAAAFPLAAIVTGNWPVWTRAGGVVALIAFMGASSFNMMKLFPYQYSSYNLLVGGIEGAQGRFYIDVWRSAHREALRLLANSTSPGNVYAVYSCGSLMNYVGYSQFRPVRDPNRAMYIIALPRRCPVSRFHGFRTVAEVKRGNVLFASILAQP